MAHPFDVDDACELFAGLPGMTEGPARTFPVRDDVTVLQGDARDLPLLDTA